jgi:hypothetical protein
MLLMHSQSVVQVIIRESGTHKVAHAFRCIALRHSSSSRVQRPRGSSPYRQRALDPPQALGFFTTYFCRMTLFLSFMLVIRPL